MVRFCQRPIHARQPLVPSKVLRPYVEVFTAKLQITIPKVILEM